MKCFVFMIKVPDKELGQNHTHKICVPNFRKTKLRHSVWLIFLREFQNKMETKEILNNLTLGHLSQKFIKV